VGMSGQSTWGTNIQTNVATISVPQSSKISNATLQQIWAQVAKEVIAELGTASVAPGTFSVTVASFGTPTPVTLTGGPVS